MTAFLTLEDVLRIHEVVEGSIEVHDLGLVESAVFRPQSTVFGQDAYPSMLDKAGALLHSLARNHGFVDGNKRTAITATIVFLRLNGYEDVADEDDLVALALDAAEGQVDAAGITARLKELVREP